MRRILIFCTFFLTLHAASPNDYSVVIKGPFEDVLFDIAEDHDNQISAAGYSQHFSTRTASQQSFNNAFDYLASLGKEHGEQIRVLRLNAKAQTTLDTSMALSQFNRAVSVIKTPSNGYFIGGYSQSGDMLVINLTDTGRINFITRFGTANFNRMHHLVALRDGGVLAVGSSVTTRASNASLHEQGLGMNDIYLTRISKTGMKLWSKKYGSPHDDRGIDAAEAYDGSIVVAGITDRGDTRTLLLMRITENGDKIWFKEHENRKIFNAYDLAALRDNNFLVSLSYLDETGKEQIALLKFGLQQNMLAERRISTKRSSALLSIKERSNGNIIGVGYSTDRQKADTDALAVSFDPFLEPLWKRHYEEGDRSLFHAVTILHDGTFAVAGETDPKGNERADMWIVKLNRDGSIASKSTDVRSLYEVLRSTFSDEIEKKQLSVTEDLRLTLIHPALLFKAGIYELNGAQKEFLNRFSQKLLGALQPYKAQIAALRVNGHTSSEWKGADFTRRYLKNAELSTQRAYSTLSHIFGHESSAPYRPWLSDILTNDGYAFSKIVKRPLEDKTASRRAEFQIILQ